MPGRRSELTGTVVPEVDDRALGRVEKKMSRSLSKVSNIMPTGGVGRLGRLGRLGRGGGGAVSGGGDVQAAQLAKLEDIHDEIKKGNVSRAGLVRGGGGGDSTVLPIPGGGGGFLGGLGAGAGLGRLSAISGTAGIFGLGAAGVIGGRWFNRNYLKHGESVLRGRNQFFGLEGLQKGLRNPLDFLTAGTKNMLDPTGIGESLVIEGAEALQDFDWPDLPEIPDLGSMDWPDLPPLDTLDWPTLPDLSQEVQWPGLPSEIQNLDQQVDWPGSPPWLKNFIDAVDRLSRLVSGGDEPNRYGVKPGQPSTDPGITFGDVVIDLAGGPGGGAPILPDETLKRRLKPIFEEWARGDL